MAEGHAVTHARSAQPRYASKREAKRAEHDRARARKGLPPYGTVYERNCRRCGGAFTSSQPSAALCSRVCRIAEVNVYDRDRSPRPCRECGEAFAPAYGDKRRVYCSGKCADAREIRVRHAQRRAKEAGVAMVDPVDPLVVCERDGWCCYICGKETPKELRGTRHPDAPEVDHVEPLAQGGEHSYANTACCCRSCNWEKGDASPREDGRRKPAFALVCE